jgi:hypothetical protein
MVRERNLSVGRPLLASAAAVLTAVALGYGSTAAVDKPADTGAMLASGESNTGEQSEFFVRVVHMSLITAGPGPHDRHLYPA